MKKLIPKIIGLYLNLLAIIAPQRAGIAGFKLFCRPLRGPLSKHHHDFLQSAEQFTLKYQDNTIQAYRWGKGQKKVLFLHGWQSHSFRWKNYIEAFDKNEFSVYCIDAPGHGLSTGHFLHVPLYSEVVKFFLEEIGNVEGIIGHSIGSFTALYTLHQHPHLSPNRMVLLAPPGEATDFFNFYMNTLGLTKQSMNLVANQFKEETGKEPSYFSATEFAKVLTCDGLIIHDEGDEDTSVENSKAIHQVWGNAELRITQGLGHNLKSKEIVKSVLDFIRKPVLKKNVPDATANVNY